MSIGSLVSVSIGVSLIVFVLMDIFKTVFMIGGGAGPQSSFAAERMWRFALRCHRPGSQRSHSWMRSVGPLIVIVVLAAWVMELSIGWALIFAQEAFVEPATLGFVDRLLFAMQSVVGRSGNSPALTVSSDVWESVHALAGITGVFIVSVGLAYVLPILNAVAHKRSIAAIINTLGNSVDEMRELAKTPNGSSFELYLVSLVSAISTTAERHRAYPVLHYFHSKDLHAALAPAVAKIALLLETDLSMANKLDATVKLPLQRSIANLMQALSRMGLTDFANDSDLVQDDELNPIVLDPSLMSNTQGDALSHAWIRAYVEFDGWDWSEVVS